MSRLPLMPKATAVWLVDNTTLTFRQIAEFCGLHHLEVKGIADGDVAAGIKGTNPIQAGELTQAELDKATKDEKYQMAISGPKVNLPTIKTKKKPKYTPISRRQDRPNAILWLVKYHPELKDSQVSRLVGTTKSTIQAIRDREHWNSANLVAEDPVGLGLCTQIDLDAEVKKAAARVEKERGPMAPPMEPVGTILPTEQTAPARGSNADLEAFGAAILGTGAPKPRQDEPAPDAAEVFANMPKTAPKKDEEPAPSVDDVFASDSKD
ncbi:MAG: cell cycle transcriptional regulator TrcR [Pseudomonadota bacterium]